MIRQTGDKGLAADSIKKPRLVHVTCDQLILMPRAEVGVSSTRREISESKGRVAAHQWRGREAAGMALVACLGTRAERRLWPLLVPTTSDFGLTWDEPAYRYSQIISAQWWEQLWHARSWNEIKALLEPDALLYYWPYARSGINFHPPLAGQLNLATHALFGSWMKDIPSRRMSSVIEFALTITIGFGFLSRRYGAWVGLIMAGSLLLMPRLYGQAHLAETDIPGLLLWACTALAFWNGLYEERGRRLARACGGASRPVVRGEDGRGWCVASLAVWMVVGHLSAIV